ncbi:MAG TPA: hypothetical protein VGX25_30695 [Actinophytocola sp.]|uniref:hypothetical protein n=1 Tax=Actinophytocola sp. TaxID=1872138 RepID=UPI002DDCA58D|nr:hypothetical protein [Actinophytocola sp.]HEV2783777.1 hypothetical protein [Actinophytocola sp.]
MDELGDGVAGRWLGKRVVARLTAEDVVLVTAAAGGVGCLLIQQARSVGAVSVRVAGGPAKVAAMRRLGAGVAVDDNHPEWTDAVRGGPAAR